MNLHRTELYAGLSSFTSIDQMYKDFGFINEVHDFKILYTGNKNIIKNLLKERIKFGFELVKIIIKQG